MLCLMCIFFIYTYVFEQTPGDSEDREGWRATVREVAKSETWLWLNNSNIFIYIFDSQFKIITLSSITYSN